MPGHERVRRRVLLVAGIDAATRSAVAHCLSLPGAALPRTRALDSASRAASGSSQPIVATHQEVFASAGTAWDDPLPIPADWHRSGEAAGYRERMASILAGEYPDADLFVVGDPHICRLVPFWIAVLDELGIRPTFFLPVRNPSEVAGTLADRDALSEPRALLLWLRYVLEAERDTRGHPRAFITHEELASDPRSAMKRACEGVGLEWAPTTDDGDFDLGSPGAARGGGPPPEPQPGNGALEWAEEVYRSISTACRVGDSPDAETLDRVSATLGDADLTYGSILVEANRRADELLARLESTELARETAERLREHSVRRADTKVRKAEEKLHESQRIRRDLDRSLRATERNLRAIEERLRDSEEARAAILESPSWRLTKPLRAAKALLLRLRGRAARRRAR